MSTDSISTPASTTATSASTTATSTSTTATSTSTYEEDMKKYTTIDNLDEDPGEDNFALISFVSPEGVMNCNVRALKIRKYKGRPAIFKEYERACTAAKELNEIDSYFDIFVMPIGKWCAWDPDPADRNAVEAEKWDNAEQQKLMDGLEKVKAKQEISLQEMNALVGKKKSLIDDGVIEHKNRVKESIKQGYAEKDGPKKELKLNSTSTANSTTTSSESEPQSEPQEKLHVRTKNHANANDVKSRLRRQLEEKKLAEKSSSSQVSPVTATLNAIEETSEQNLRLQENINKIKALTNKV